MIHFAHPLFLLLGILASFAVFLFFRKMRQKRETALHQFASPELAARLLRTTGSRERFYKEAALIAVIFCIFTALARPQYGYRWENVKRKGIDILFAIDTSQSMLTEDIKPNRLQRAKMAIYDFVSRLDGDRVGLMPFAGSAYLMCPLTMDYQTFEESLDSVDTAIIPEGGTNIASVINEAEMVLREGSNHKIVIIVTDGENLQGDAISAAKKNSEKGLVIYTVGIGSEEGALIPIQSQQSQQSFADAFGGTLQNGRGSAGFITDRNGNLVRSKLDSKTLKQIAKSGGGIYAPLLAENGGEDGLDIIYQKKLALVPKEELAERRRKVPKERFQWPLAAAILLLVIEFLIGERRGKEREQKEGERVKSIKRRVEAFWKKRRVVSVLLLASLLYSAVPVDVNADVNADVGADVTTATNAENPVNGNAQQEGDKDEAIYRKQLAKEPNNPALHYNLGTLFFQKKEFAKAIDSFNKALHSEDLSLQQKAYYNRGNALYYRGGETIQKDPEQTIADWEKALQSLQAASNLNSGNSLGGREAKENYALIEKELKKLKEQEKKRKEEQQKQQKQDTKDDNKESKENKEKGNKGGKEEKEKENKKENKQNNSEQGKSKTEEEKQQNRPQESRKKEKDTQQKSEKRSEEKTQEQQKKSSAKNSGKDDNKEKKQTPQNAANKEQRKQIESINHAMNKKEAEQLLNSLQSDEEAFHFAPARRSNEQVEKDW